MRVSTSTFHNRRSLWRPDRTYLITVGVGVGDVGRTQSSRCWKVGTGRYSLTPIKREVARRLVTSPLIQ
jgi:hypothetical protein